MNQLIRLLSFYGVFNNMLCPHTFDVDKRIDTTLKYGKLKFFILLTSNDICPILPQVFKTIDSLING